MLDQKIKTLNAQYGSALGAISDCLRGFIVSKPNHVFIGVDFSAIESRVLCWLAGQNDAIAVYEGDGKIYERTAGTIYNIPWEKVNAHQRLVGKVAELALGYQGGEKAIARTARAYGFHIEKPEREQIKLRWRGARARITSFWYAVEQAAIHAAINKGEAYRVDRGGACIKYKVNGSFLWCKLPSGRLICYPYPAISSKETPWGDYQDALTYKTTDSFTRKWGPHTAYGGLLTENIVQAVARDVMGDAMKRLEAAGYPIVLHIHDEVVVEVPKEVKVETIEGLMSEKEPWAKGLPVKAEGWKDDRYRK